MVCSELNERPYEAMHMVLRNVHVRLPHLSQLLQICFSARFY